MESILALANGQKQEKQNCNIASMVEEVFNCLCRDFAKDGITVNVAIPKELTIVCCACSDSTGFDEPDFECP